MIFRAIKVKATVSRSDRSISFCSTLFILSFSLSFIFSNSNDFVSNSLFHRDSRMFVSFDRDERIELIRTKSINLSCFNTFFFFFSFIQCMQFSIISRDVQTLDWIYVEGKLQARSTCDPAKTF